MQADHNKIQRLGAAGTRRLWRFLTALSSRFLAAAIAICAASPLLLLLLAAEPVKPDAPVKQQPLEASAPKRIKFVYASFPELALRQGMTECFVELRFTVLPDGSTTDIEVIHSEPVPLFALFEESAIQAVKQWRYEPAIRNGKPVAQTTEVRIKFEGGKNARP